MKAAQFDHQITTHTLIGHTDLPVVMQTSILLFVAILRR
jgi:hypothetical protein